MANLVLLTRDLYVNEPLKVASKDHSPGSPALYFDKVIGTPYIRFRMMSRARGKLTFFVPFKLSYLPACKAGALTCHTILLDLISTGGNILIYSSWRGHGAEGVVALSDRQDLYDQGNKDLLPCLSVKAIGHIFKRLQFYVDDDL